MYQKLTFFCITRLYFVLYAFGALHLSRELYKSTLFMQNKPNFKKGKMNLNPYNTKAYQENHSSLHPKNKPNSKPKQTQSKPKQTQYKPNTNPIKPNFKLFAGDVIRRKLCSVTV